VTRTDLFWAQAVAKTAQDYHLALVTNHVPSRVVITKDGVVETKMGPETQRQIDVCERIASCWARAVTLFAQFDNMAAMAHIQEIGRLFEQLDGGLRVRPEIE
jgi:hypothetical protein